MNVLIRHPKLFLNLSGGELMRVFEGGGDFLHTFSPSFV